MSDRRDNRPHPQAGENYRKKGLTPTLLQFQIAPYIANEEPKRFLFNLIYDPDRFAGFLKFPAEKNSLIIRPLKRIKKQITDHPMRQPALGQ